MAAKCPMPQGQVRVMLALAPDLGQLRPHYRGNGGRARIFLCSYTDRCRKDATGKRTVNPQGEEFSCCDLPRKTDYRARTYVTD
jgi:hypothetical protein